MKVAIIINELTIRGGTHKQVLRLCEYLQQNEVDFTIFTKQYDCDKTYPEFRSLPVRSLGGCKTQVCSKGILGKVYNLMLKKSEDKQLFRMIPKDIDIVNVHDNGTIWLIKWCKSKLKTHVIWQINDLPYCFRVWESNKIRRSLYYKMSRLFYRSITKKVDQITVNVSKNKERVINYMHKEAKVLYCGVDTNKALKRHQYPGKEGKYHILSTGVFFERRNYTTLVEVISQLKEEGMSVHLDIIGSTELDSVYAKKVKDVVTESGVEDEVTIWGQINENKYNELYNRADVFAFININQSWGLAVFEAMSCGIPVVVSDSVGAIELLHNKYDAIIVDPMDKCEICSSISRLLENEECYRMISENAYNAVREFTWDRLYSSGVLQLYRDLWEV